MGADFPFARNAEIQLPRSADVARIAAGIRSKADLARALATALRFPSHSGESWDALDDRLTDLSWLQPTLVLLHDAVPHLPRKELVIYLEILSGALDAAREEGRVLIIGFPERTKALSEAWAGVKT